MDYAKGMEIQQLRGATGRGWTPHSRSHIADIAAWKGSVYGVGMKKDGDYIYRFSGQHWERTSKGTCCALAIGGTCIYASGQKCKGDQWVYKQPLENLSLNSKWEKAFRVHEHLKSCLTSITVLPSSSGAKSLALGIGSGCVWRFWREEQQWMPEPPNASLRCAAFSISAAPAALLAPEHLPAWQAVSRPLQNPLAGLAGGPVEEPLPATRV